MVVMVSPHGEQGPSPERPRSPTTPGGKLFTSSVGTPTGSKNRARRPHVNRSPGRAVAVRVMEKRTGGSGEKCVLKVRLRSSSRENPGSGTRERSTRTPSPRRSLEFQKNSGSPFPSPISLPATAAAPLKSPTSPSAIARQMAAESQRLIKESRKLTTEIQTEQTRLALDIVKTERELEVLSKKGKVVPEVGVVVAESETESGKKEDAGDTIDNAEKETKRMTTSSLAVGEETSEKPAVKMIALDLAGTDVEGNKMEEKETSRENGEPDHSAAVPDAIDKVDLSPLTEAEKLRWIAEEAKRDLCKVVYSILGKEQFQQPEREEPEQDIEQEQKDIEQGERDIEHEEKDIERGVKDIERRMTDVEERVKEQEWQDENKEEQPKKIKKPQTANEFLLEEAKADLWRATSYVEMKLSGVLQEAKKAAESVNKSVDVVTKIVNSKVQELPAVVEQTKAAYPLGEPSVTNIWLLEEAKLDLKGAFGDLFSCGTSCGAQLHDPVNDARDLGAAVEGLVAEVGVDTVAVDSQENGNMITDTATSASPMAEQSLALDRSVDPSPESNASIKIAPTTSITYSDYDPETVVILRDAKKQTNTKEAEAYQAEVRSAIDSVRMGNKLQDIIMADIVENALAGRVVKGMKEVTAEVPERNVAGDSKAVNDEDQEPIIEDMIQAKKMEELQVESKDEIRKIVKQAEVVLHQASLKSGGSQEDSLLGEDIPNNIGEDPIIQRNSDTKKLLSIDSSPTKDEGKADLVKQAMTKYIMAVEKVGMTCDEAVKTLTSSDSDNKTEAPVRNLLRAELALKEVEEILSIESSFR